MQKLKACLLLFLSLTTLASCAQWAIPPESPIEERSLQKVHEIKLSKNEIYDRALEWMAQTFVDSKAVIELKDKENGKIIGKGMSSFNVDSGLILVPIPCRFTLILEAKDNKYRTTYDNFTGMWGKYHNEPIPLKHKPHIDSIKNVMIELDKSLYDYLNKAKSNSQW